MKNEFSVTVKNKRFDFQISGPSEKYGGKELYLLKSNDWPIEQHFTAKDLSKFLSSGDLHYFILEELKEKEKQANSRLQFRVSSDEKTTIEKKAISAGKTVSEYLREVALG